MRCHRHPVTGPASSSLRHHAGARAFLVGLAINHMHACMVFLIRLGSRCFIKLHFFHHFFKACQLFQRSILGLHVGILLNDPQLFAFIHPRKRYLLPCVYLTFIGLSFYYYCQARKQDFLPGGAKI